jgi:hypothetical protein
MSFRAAAHRRPVVASLLAVAAAAGCSKPSDAVTDHVLTVNLRVDGGGEAAVRAMAAGLTCAGGACTGKFPVGTVVRLFPATGADAPDPAVRFVRWGPECTGPAPFCDVVLDADVTTTATFLGANYVFITSLRYGADQVAPAAADAKCQAHASAAGLPGTYAAWISTSAVNAPVRLGAARGWVRVDGLPFADEVASLVAGEVFYPVALDENGFDRRAIWLYAAFTGTRNDGVVDRAANCSDWTSTADTNVLIGLPDSGAGGWSGGAGASCGSQYALLCFGTDATRAVAPAPSAGRRAFVSAGLRNGGVGLAALDALCASEAAAAGLGGTFKALVATTTASAVSRFDLQGAPWVRTDGVPVVAGAADLATGTFVAPIEVLADGASHATSLTMQGRLAWTGASGPTWAGAATTTCEDWTSAAATSTGIAGSYTSSYAQSPFGTAGRDCSVAQRVYCLQQ